MREVPCTLHPPSIESILVFITNPYFLGSYPEHCYQSTELTLIAKVTDALHFAMPKALL